MEGRLEDRLAEHRARFEDRTEDEAVWVLHRATRRLEEDGAAREAVGVGDTAPDFELPSQTGEAVRLSDAASRGPVVLGFYRGRWCPYCNLELEALDAAVGRIREEGARLILVSPQTPEQAEKTAERFDLEATLLSDEGNETAARYGLVHELSEELRELYLEWDVDLEEYNGDASWTLPMPARYVIDSSRTVRWASVQADHTRRPDPAETIAALGQLGDPWPSVIGGS